MGTDELARATAERIARERLGIETLGPRGSDAADFHDLHVDAIRAALEGAFEAGWRAAGAAERFTWRDGDVELEPK